MDAVGAPVVLLRRPCVEGAQNQSVLDLLGAAGMSSPDEIAPRHICRSASPSSVKTYEELYDFVKEGSLLEEPYPPSLDEIWRRSSPFQFPFSRLAR